MPPASIARTMPWGTVSPIQRSRFGAAALVVLVLLTGCGGSSATPTPTPAAATATPKPDTHLAEPASGREVYTRLNEAGLGLVGTNAAEGTEPRSRINASYAGWPLALLEYSTTTARAKSVPFRDGGAPGAGQPAFTFAGLNIAVLWGPSTQGHVPAPPDATKVEAAKKLAEALGVLVGPLAERSVTRVTVPLPTATPPPSVAPSPSPSATPTATP